MSALVVVRAGPGASVQDAGRPGRLSEGLPPSGALWPELFSLANRSLGNADDAAAVELVLHGATFRAEGALTLSLDGAVRSLADGETFEARSTEQAVRYLALAGGVAAPVRLGSRSTLASAGLGGWLRPGDRLRALADAPARARELPLPADDGSPIRLVPGPDVFPPDALELLFATEFRISTAFDRVGVRLDGARLPTPPDRAFSAPMIRGALQVAHDGTPIVLGPDHPTTGGYPVVATVVTSELGRLARLRPGSPVRFRPAG